MIPDLLWRCPLCASNDALIHRPHWLRAEVVNCTACGAQWRVRRVVGDNYYLKITRSNEGAATYPPGFELSITAWYDLMKQTVHLEALPGLSDLLEAGERLYLTSGPVTLWVEAQPTPGAGPLPLATAQAGPGRLFLTSRRLIWRQSSMEPQTFSFPLHQVNGIHAILNLGLSVVVGMQQYTLRFANESPLKWVTYAALLAPQVQAENGHRIRTSHY